MHIDLPSRYHLLFNNKWSRSDALYSQLQGMAGVVFSLWGAITRL